MPAWNRIPSCDVPRPRDGAERRLAGRGGGRGWSRSRTPGAGRAPGTATGSAGGRTSPSASGARCARTTRADGDCWDYFPHDHARSRAYRWGEDGLLGITDRAVPALLRARALERARPDPQGAALRPHRPRGQPRRGRQGAATSTSTPRRPTRTCKALYKYPQAEFPYERLVDENRRARQAATRSSSSSTPASSTTTATSTSSSSTPRRARRHPDPDHRRQPRARGRRTLHLLPTLWFRNTWSWGCARRGLLAARPSIRARRATRAGGRPRERSAASGSTRTPADGPAPELLFTENETNAGRLFGAPNPQPLRQGRLPRATSSTGEREAVNPAGEGTKAAVRTTRSTSRPGGAGRAAPAPAATEQTPAQAVRDRLRATCSTTASPRPTRSTPSGSRRRRPTTSAASLRQALRRAALEQAVLPLRRPATGSRAIPAQPPPPAERAAAAATPTGRTSTTAT